jgi:hypothetical protein
MFVLFSAAKRTHHPVDMLSPDEQLVTSLRRLDARALASPQWWSKLLTIKTIQPNRHTHRGPIVSINNMKNNKSKRIFVFFLFFWAASDTVGKIPKDLYFFVSVTRLNWNLSWLFNIFLEPKRFDFYASS